MLRKWHHCMEIFLLIPYVYITSVKPTCIYISYIHIAPEPQFELTEYTVPENNRDLQLCVVVDLAVTQNTTYTITARQKSPPEAQG